MNITKQPQIAKTLVGRFDEIVLDWMRETPVVKYEKYSHPDFIVDIDATKVFEHWGSDHLEDFITLFRANCSFDITDEEIRSYNYVHVKLNQ